MIAEALAVLSLGTTQAVSPAISDNEAFFDRSSPVADFAGQRELLATVACRFFVLKEPECTIVEPPALGRLDERAGEWFARSTDGQDFAVYRSLGLEMRFTARFRSNGSTDIIGDYQYSRWWPLLDDPTWEVGPEEISAEIAYIGIPVRARRPVSITVQCGVGLNGYMKYCVPVDVGGNIILKRQANALDVQVALSVSANVRLASGSEDSNPQIGKLVSLHVQVAPPTHSDALDVRPPGEVSPVDPAQLRNLYPSRALDAGIGGDVMLICAANVDGHMDSCTVMSERPSSYGFAAAALEIAELRELTPASVGGTPIRSFVHQRIRWQP